MTLTEDSNTVSVIDGKYNSLAENIMVYVTHSGPSSNTTSVTDGKTNKVLGTVIVEFDPEAITVNPDTNMVYVVNTNSNTVSLLIQK